MCYRSQHSQQNYDKGWGSQPTNQSVFFFRQVQHHWKIGDVMFRSPHEASSVAAEVETDPDHSKWVPVSKIQNE